MLSSTADWPSTTIPSTGILSPGLTITMSPTATCSMGTSCSCPSRTTRAVLARKPISSLMAALVCPLARASNSLPSLMRVMMTAAVSK